MYMYINICLCILLSSHQSCLDSLRPHRLARQASLSLAISWSLPKFMSIESVMHSTILSSDTLFFFCPQSFPASGTFLMSQLFTSDDQNTGISASASVLPMSIQGWFPLRLISLISLLFKGLSGVFSSATVQRYQFFSTLPYSPALTTVHDLWEDHSLDYTDVCWPSNVCFSTHCLGLS